MTKVFDRFADCANVGVSMMDPEGGAVQAGAEECDLNKIVARHKATGMAPVVPGGVFADVSAMGDYQGALKKVESAMEAFGELPAAVRRKFKDDPFEVIDFVSNPANRDEAIKLGLVSVPASPSPDSGNPQPEPALPVT